MSVRVWYIDHAGVRRRLDPSKATRTAKRLTTRMVPREVKLTLPANSQIRELDTVIVEKQGNVLFRGYVKFLEIDYSRNETTVSCYGMEDLLNYRVTPIFYLDQYHTPTMGEVFADTLIDGEIPGLLACANSYIMPGQSQILQTGGTVYNPIVKLPGMGTSSDIGTADLYYLAETSVKKLEELHEASMIAAGDTKYIFYRDANDLTVVIGYNNRTTSWNMGGGGGIFAANHKDTTCRLGPMTSDVAEKALEGTLLYNYNMIGDFLVSLAAAHGLFVTITDDWGRTYVNISEDEGRGLQESPWGGHGVIEFGSDELRSVRKRARAQVTAHSIMGRGMALPYYTRDDHAPRPIKIEKIIDINNEFADANGKLVELIDDEYEDQKESNLYTIEPIRNDLVLYPMDWIKFTPPGGNPILACIDAIDDDLLSGSMKLDLKQAKTDISDIWLFMAQVDSEFVKFYPWKFVDDVSASDNQDVSNPSYWFDLVFDIPRGVVSRAATYKTRIVLMMTITANSDATSRYADNLGAIKFTLKNTNSVNVYASNALPAGGSHAASWSIPPIDVTDYIKDDATTATLHFFVEGITPPTPPTNWSSTGATVSGTLSFYKRAG